MSYLQKKRIGRGKTTFVDFFVELVKSIFLQRGKRGVDRPSFFPSVRSDDDDDDRKKTL